MLLSGWGGATGTGGLWGQRPRKWDEMQERTLSGTYQHALHVAGRLQRLEERRRVETWEPPSPAGPQKPTALAHPLP